MNVVRNIWRSVPVLRSSVNYQPVVRTSVNCQVFTRPLSASVIPAVKPSENVPLAAEPDKLYKRVELEMRGIDQAVLLSYSWFCVAAASHLGIDVTKSWAARKADKERHTLLRSVHIYKKHRVQYEIRTYFRFIHMQRLTGSTCDTYLEYIERNLPEGCALKVTKIECHKLPDYITAPTEKV